MTYDQAIKKAIKQGEQIRRACWSPGWLASYFKLEQTIFVTNPRTGSHTEYEPTEADMSANDWELFDRRKEATR